MTTTHTRTKFLTAAVSAAIATIATPALLVLGAGTAQATPDISARGPVGIVGDLPTPRMCPSCGGFNPQPDSPGYPDPLPALTPIPTTRRGPTSARASHPGSAMGLHLPHQNPAAAHERADAPT
jgi:hypothetical protein